MLDGMPPGIPLGEQSINVPALILRLETVEFDWVRRGNEFLLQIKYPHPLLPLAIEIPFTQLYYLRRFQEGATRAVEVMEQTETS